MADSDLFKRLFDTKVDTHSEISDYLSSGVDAIIRERRDPYYTIVKTKLHDNYLWSDIIVDDIYKRHMMDKLTSLFWKFTDTQLFERHFIEICMEYVKSNNTAISKSGLIYLNNMNSSIGKYLL